MCVTGSVWGYDEGIDVAIDRAQCGGGDTICNDILSIDKLFVCQPGVTTQLFSFFQTFCLLSVLKA